MKFSYPIFYLANNNWPLLDWSLDSTGSGRLGQEWPPGEPVAVDLPSVLSSPYKIAAIPSHCDDTTMCDYDAIIEQVKLSEFDLVVVSHAEFLTIKQLRQWIEKHQIKNYVLSVGGLAHGEQLDPSCEIYRPIWSYILTNKATFRDTNVANKPYMFEAMLGVRRYHRDFVMRGFILNNLVDTSVIAYRNLHHLNYDPAAQRNIFGDVNIEFPYISPSFDPAWETPLDHSGRIPSADIPWEVYRRTYYSIVCETLFNGDVFFMTEKTAKPLFGKRLFVVFSSANFLYNLKKLGFETFDSVIDESYDAEPNNFKRFTMAFDQVVYLSKQDPDRVYEKIKPIVEHNHRRLLQLQEDTRQQMQLMLQAKTSG